MNFNKNGEYMNCRWFGTFRRRPTGSNSSNGGDNADDFSQSLECYACTQVGVPGFHSTTCNQAQQPQWEASAGSSLVPIQNHQTSKPRKPISGRRPPTGPFGTLLDPRSKRVQKWNRAFLLFRGVALAIDPLFFYALSIGRSGSPCLLIDGSVAAGVTALRTCIDAVHLYHMWLQFRLAYVSRESLVIGCGKLVWDWNSIAKNYLLSFQGFWFDAFVVLPFPQMVFWLLIPRLIMEEKIELTIIILLLVFVVQYLPKIYHWLILMRRMKKVTGYLFGSIWWGFGINLIAYFIASHVAGGCWYILAIKRVAKCVGKFCNSSAFTFSSSQDNSYQFLQQTTPSYGNSTVKFRVKMCLDENGPFPYGIYSSALQVVSSSSIAVKTLYPISWGLMSLSTFGNTLVPTSNWLEVIFSICIVLSGLMLFTMLAGNIQVFLHAVMSRKRKMQLRVRDMGWWMKRRQLPFQLRQRVVSYESQKWSSVHADDETEFIKDLPEGLRRDIKRFLCLDLIKKVPLFHQMDDLILDNICDRVKPLVFSKDEKIIREGDAVQMIVFIVCGRVTSCQKLSKGKEATSTLEPGGYLGDELLSWCLRRPFIDRLPASSATFTCLESIEAFALYAHDLRYIADHFRYKFIKESLKRTARYYSSNWRTWAAVKLQFAWRRRQSRTTPSVLANHRVINGDRDARLRRYAAVFMSIRPHDHPDIE